MKYNILPDDIVQFIRGQGKILEFGSIKLEIFLRDGKPRWDISNSLSLLPETIKQGIDAVSLKTTGGAA